MLYKSSDADNRPNLKVLSQLVSQHGNKSEEVQAFIDLYANDQEFMNRAQQILSYESKEKPKGENE